MAKLPSEVGDLNPLYVSSKQVRTDANLGGFNQHQAGHQGSRLNSEGLVPVLSSAHF
jgi:hypothetical protein